MSLTYESVLAMYEKFRSARPTPILFREADHAGQHDAHVREWRAELRAWMDRQGYDE